MDEVSLLNIEKIVQGLRAFKENEYVRKHELEARIGKPLVREMIGMNLIETKKEGNEECYRITNEGESLYFLRRKREGSLYSLVGSRLKLV